MDIELLKRYFSNNCSPEEVDEVFRWFKNNAGSLGGRSLMKQIWDKVESREVEEVDFENMLNKIHHRINVAEAEKEFTRKITRQGLQVLLNGFMKVAAILFIPLLVISLNFYYTKINEDKDVIYSEVSSPFGSRTSFELPDGSKVWLNNGSTLRFPVRFNGKYRELELTGEAYFDIAHNEKQPLIVKTGGIGVKVLGTKFNVMSYADDQNIEVTLKSGKVAIQKLFKNGGSKNLLVLKPDQQAIFNKKEKSIKYRNINAEKYTSWKDGKLIFINDPIDLIMKRLERWFNVDIILKDKELSNFTYTATFTDEQLTQVLNLLQVATPINYKIIPSHKLKDGSYTRQKVIISIKK
jgi:ferric-dicitrate binding protein FerR (iron transport regulator)